MEHRIGHQYVFRLSLIYPSQCTNISVQGGGATGDLAGASSEPEAWWALIWPIHTCKQCICFRALAEFPGISFRRRNVLVTKFV